MKNNIEPIIEHKTVRAAMEASCLKYKDLIAFRLKHKNRGEISYEDISYAEFLKDVYSFSMFLRARGYEHARVAITGVNSYQWIVSYFGTIFAGHVAVPIDKELQPGELKYSLEESRSDVLVYGIKSEDKILEALEGSSAKVKMAICMDSPKRDFDFNHLIGSSSLVFSDCIAEGRKELPYDDVEVLAKELPIKALEPNEPALFLFTSGTTSNAKAVMLSNRNMASNVYGLASSLPGAILPGDVNLCFLPLHHTLGLTGQTYLSFCGVTTVFCDGLKYIQDNMVEYKVSVFVSVPLLLEMMRKKILKAAEKQGKLKALQLLMKVSEGLMKMGIDVRRKLFGSVLSQLGGALRLVVMGAAPMDPEAQHFFDVIGITAIQGYGLTETAPVLAAERPWDKRLGSVGKPLTNVEIRIDNAGPDGIGEIMCKGPNVMLGYSRPKDNEGMFEGEWMHTGDLGYFDKDGYLFIKGRQKNVIVLKNGKNVYPEELEDLITQALPQMSDVLVFGWEKDGDLLVCANMVCPEIANMSEEQVAAMKDEVRATIDKINTTLPPYKLIRRLLLSAEEMEKTSTAKVKRPRVIPLLQKRNDYF